MKRLILFLLVVLALAIPSFAQGHSAVITWPAPSDAVAASTYKVYRASGACPASAPGTLTWTNLTATPISALTYTDSTITVGAWCYYVTQVQAGIESVPSNPAGGTARPNAISVITVVIT
jgi:hypothetical protein